MSPAELDKFFTYHPPKGDQPDRYAEIRANALHMARVINENCPDGPDKSAAIRKLRECVMTANASIALEP
jgi:hypothetical protein